MPDLLTLIIFPLTVAVIALVIEYWIILPFKEFTRKRKAILTSTSQNSYLSEMLLRIILLSGVVTFFLVVIITYSVFRETPNPLYSQLDDFSNSLPGFVSDVITDVNIVFAAIVYTCLVINLSVLKSSVRSAWSLMFTGIIAPPALVLLWTIIFFGNNWFYFLICLVVINLWILWLDATDYWHSIFIVSLFLFPANALLLIKFANYVPFLAWICSLAIFFTVNMIRMTMENREAKHEENPKQVTVTAIPVDRIEPEAIKMYSDQDE
jgi:hypothetical protein